MTRRPGAAAGLAARLVAALAGAAGLAGLASLGGLGAALAAGLPGCGPPPAPRNVLIVSFDTLRADRLGCYGNREWDASPSPQADALASRGVLFDHAMAPRGQTHPSLAAMLTGKFPITTGVRENGLSLPENQLTLFQRLQRAGFRTGVFVANFDRGDPADDWVFRGADVASDGFQGRFAVEWLDQSRFQAQWDDRVERAATDFLRDADGPFAMWVHFYDLHKPYNPPAESLARFGAGGDLPDVLAAPGPDSGGALDALLDGITLGDQPVPDAVLRRIRGLYDGTLAATDARLGRLLEALAAADHARDTLVVFTADHGEELFDRDRYFFHGNSVHQGVLRLPLVIAGPGLPAGARVAAPVQNVDLPATVLDLLGLPAATDMEGRSLAPLLRDRTAAPPRPYSFAEWQDLVSVVSDGERTYIHNPRHAHPLKEPFRPAPGTTATRGYRIDCFEGYDLRTDPLEQHDLLAGLDPATLATPDGLPAPFQPLRRALDAWLVDPTHERTMSWPGLTPERLEKLRQLGYVGTGEQRPDVLFGGGCGK